MWPLLTLPVVLAFVAWIIAAKATKLVSLASLVAATVLFCDAIAVVFLSSTLEHAWPLLVVTGLIACMVIWKHRSNIGRIIRGEEAKLESIPNWIWDPKAANFRAGLARLRAYVEQFGNAHAPHRYDSAAAKFPRWTSMSQMTSETWTTSFTLPRDLARCRTLRWYFNARGSSRWCKHTLHKRRVNAS